MRPSLKVYTRQLLRDFFSFKKSSRARQIPFLAALCVGIPLFISFAIGELTSGLTVSLAGLVILYLPVKESKYSHLKKLLWCSIGFIVSYTVGLLFSFNFIVSCIAFGIYSGCIHWIILRLKIKPPGNFFFIMLASISSCIPYNLALIPFKVTLIAIGTLVACILAFIYSISTNSNINSLQQNSFKQVLPVSKAQYFLESCILGFFMFLSLFVGHLLHLQNAYWIPISCLAVLQGVSLYHIWSRVLQRIIGTFIGLALCWLILAWFNTPLYICLAIVCLQFIVELLIVRHYALAVVFITPMTLLLVEAANPMLLEPNHLLSIRLTDIAIGSLIGAIGGWILHNEKIRQISIRKMQKAKLVFKNNSKFFQTKF